MYGPSGNPGAYRLNNLSAPATAKQLHAPIDPSMRFECCQRHQREGVAVHIPGPNEGEGRRAQARAKMGRRRRQQPRLPSDMASLRTEHVLLGPESQGAKGSGRPHGGDAVCFSSPRPLLDHCAPPRTSLSHRRCPAGDRGAGEAPVYRRARLCCAPLVLTGGGPLRWLRSGITTKVTVRPSPRRVNFNVLLVLPRLSCMSRAIFHVGEFSNVIEEDEIRVD